MYHIGASLGGQPVDITLHSAKGMTRTIADQPWVLVDVTAFAISSSAGTGHLKLLMDVPAGEEYPMFQFTMEHTDGGTTWCGTVLIENSNSTAWKRP